MKKWRNKMSLLALPESGYTYLNITSSEGWSFTGEGLDQSDSAQWWVDSQLSEKEYIPAIWWKFWKKTTTFRVFACGGTTTHFSQTIALHHK
jgi:hypothetical protein